MRSRSAAAGADEVAKRAAHGRLGAAITLALTGGTFTYGLASRGHLPVPVLALTLTAFVATAYALRAASWERTMAGRGGSWLPAAWGVVTVTATGILAAFDGGVDSPMLLWLFPVLAYAAVGYRPREVLGLGSYALATAGAVALGAPDQVGTESALAAVVLAVHILNARLIAGNSRGQRRRLALATRRLRHLADHDPLTGCGNRRALQGRAEGLLEEDPDGSHCLLLIDIDRFKSVNDTFGHAVGDQALRAVATALNTEVRPDDRLARIGGEEFAVLLHGFDVPAAGRVAERLRRAVIAAGNHPPLTVSVGVGRLEGGGGGLDAALGAADTALYGAKAAGRNRVWGPYGPMTEPHGEHPRGLPTRVTRSAVPAAVAAPPREELVAGRPIGFWVGQARIAAFIPGLTGLACVAYAAARDRPDGGALVAVVALTTATVTAMGLLPWKRIVRRTQLKAFFLWSGLDLGAIMLMAALDGGAGSPLALLLYPTALFIGTSYGRGHVLLIVAGGGLGLVAGTLAGGEVGRAIMEAIALGTLAAATIAFADRQREGVAREQILGERLRTLADTDALTGLLGRRAFLERARTLHEAGPSVVCIVDLDHFKQVNDRFGHAVGDQVLAAAAMALASAVGPSKSAVGRLGGEEFAVVLESGTGEDLLQAGERLRHAVADARATVPITASVGVVSVSGSATSSLEESLARADEALYRAKTSGRDRVCAVGATHAVGAL